jgi:hypothetical protein
MQPSLEQKFCCSVMLFPTLLLCTVICAQAYVKLPASLQTDGPVLTLHNFTTATGATGRVAVVHKPVDHFHIYYPVNQSRLCDGLELTSVQSKVHSCEFATNGGINQAEGHSHLLGPFSYHSPTCVGNIVSDGTIIQASSAGGKVIGLTNDKHWILGPVTADDVRQLGIIILFPGLMI